MEMYMKTTMKYHSLHQLDGLFDKDTIPSAGPDVKSWNYWLGPYEQSPKHLNQQWTL